MYAHTHMHMVKVISLSEEAYEKLKSKKTAEKSFSDVVIELTEPKKKPLSDLFGILKDDKETIKIFEDVLKERRRIKLRPAKF